MGIRPLTIHHTKVAVTLNCEDLLYFCVEVDGWIRVLEKKITLYGRKSIDGPKNEDYIEDPV